ncbi:chitin-binding protein [Photobacterium lutimaris]|uniref:Chitin-binding protein n=1 Tax=Photobacterium lutimaris TaxID=388278 RepID=A0A2T3J5A8_9GAMM|nr:chitin-binding protein [Photobacterium lutimaris]
MTDPDPGPSPDPDPGPNPDPDPTTAIPWVPGQTTVKDGDIVIYGNTCYTAKNTPGKWESPSASSWFWDVTDCPTGSNPDPDPDPGPNPDPDPAPGEFTIIPDGNGGYLMPRSELTAYETSQTNTELFNWVRSDIETRDNVIVDAVAPMKSSNPENVQRAEMVVDEATWEFLFPLRNEQYTYTRFLQSIAKFPAFCRTYTDGRNSDDICRRSLATMFAHFVQETGANAPNWETSKGVPRWRQGLYYLREMYKDENVHDMTYSKCSGWQGERWPCAPSKSYFGRGAKQLSWNYNYGPFSEAMFGDKQVLLENPALVADTWLNLASAIFFYVYPQPPKPSMLHVIDGTWQPNAADKAAGIELGFGATIQIINGAFECNKGAEDFRAQNRIDYYQLIAKALSLDISGEKLGCANMKPFNTDGAGALMITWDKDWGYNANTPGNKSFMCKLVPYQYTFNALFQGDYEKCVEYHFNVQAIDESGQVIPDDK